jgi:hypothetical protein
VIGRNNSSKQSVYLQRLTRARERLLAAIDGLDQATICTEPVVGDWTIKDIFGHIVSWDEELRDEIHLILAGRHPGYERLISGADDFKTWNDDWVARKQDWSWPRLLADFEEDMRAASHLILEMQPGVYRQRGVTPWKAAALTRPERPTREDTDSVETLLSYHWRHINQHARMIEKWRK